MKTERLTIETLDDQGCFNVLRTMLRYMGREYREAYKNYLEDPENAVLAKQYKSIRNEFLSRYFFNLTHLDGEYIVKTLDAQIAKEHSASCA